MDKTALSLAAFVAICVLLIACQKKERPQVELPNLSPTAISPLNSDALYDAPLVFRNSYGTSIHHLQRLSDYSLTSRIDTTQSRTPTISIYANSEFQFEVGLREEHPSTAPVLGPVDTILVSSDIEGNYQAFVSLLEGNGVIDASKNWIYNDNHLVLIGDMLDRGDQVLQVLWLIYKLEAEAQSAGGGVHYILGNHEQMNLRSKFRPQNTAYVHPEYMRHASALGIPYQEWFEPNAELGRWLRSKNAILSIDSILFLHGGISKKTAGLQLSIEEINETIRTSMSTVSEDMDRSAAILHSADGPLWYRGMANQNMSQNSVNKLLRAMQAKQSVIGHTIVHGHHIQPLYNDKLIPIDLHHTATYKQGIVRALLIDTVGFYEIDNKRQTQLLFLHHPIEI